MSLLTWVKLGLNIVFFSVKSFIDEKGVIDNLGIGNIFKISKEASIAKAQAEKEIAIAEANADKGAKNIELKAAEEIAEKANKLEIKKADLKIESDSIKNIVQIWQWLSLWILFTPAVLRSQDIKVIWCLLWFDYL